MRYLIPGCTQPLPGDSPRDLVYYMLGNTTTFMQYSAETYMRHFAMTFYDVSGGQLLTTSNPDDFVADLVAYGWLTQLP